MKIVPDRLKNIINSNFSIKNTPYNELVIFENELFLIVKDIKSTYKSYHYTAWSKKDIRSIIEIDANIIKNIKEIQEYLLDKSIITNTHIAFIHFPPQYWRLHIHFVQDNHIFEAPEHEIIKIEDIIKYYSNDNKYFIKNIRLIKKEHNLDIDKSHQEWLQ